MHDRVEHDPADGVEHAVDALVAALHAALEPDALEVALERGRRTELAAAVELAMAAARSRSA